MPNLPFVFHAAHPLVTTGEIPGRDVPATEEFLPAILESNTAGHVLSRTTRVTEVRRETTDDN